MTEIAPWDELTPQAQAVVRNELLAAIEGTAMEASIRDQIAENPDEIPDTLLKIRALQGGRS